MSLKLSTSNHDRKIFKGKYIYPVVSRRAGGLSLGINLNTNNACNWQCIYCEVPNLTRGKPEAINLNQLQEELIYWLEQILRYEFLENHTDPGTAFNDIAFSGNGEPTAASEFGEAIKIVTEQIYHFQLENSITVSLITNGSYLDKPVTHKAWSQLENLQREIWFKIDAIDPVDCMQINQINLSRKSVESNLNAALQISPTIIQTCLIKINGQLPTETAINNYVDFLRPFVNKLTGIHLYSLARPTEQKSPLLIERLTNNELTTIADKIKKLNISIRTFL